MAKVIPIKQASSLVKDRSLEPKTTGSKLSSLIGLFSQIANGIEKHLAILSGLGLLIGILLAKTLPRFAMAVDTAVSGIIDGYAVVAPVVVFLVVAPALSKLISLDGRRLIKYALLLLAMQWVLACIWGALFTSGVLGLPLFPDRSTTVEDALSKSSDSFLWMVTHSRFFFAIYLGIIVGILSPRVPSLLRLLERFAAYVEQVGGSLVLLTPLFLTTVGAYIFALPQKLRAEIGLQESGLSLAHVRILGLEIQTNSSTGMILLYLAGGLLTGVAVIAWHSGLLGWTKRVVKDFSVRRYLRVYLSKIYPLLWATCSESLAAPVNLFLAKKYYPEVQTEVRRFSLGVGTAINSCGTLVCVFVIAGLATTVLGIQISLMELLLAVPMVALIGIALPGIPGELIIFAGPLADLFGIDGAQLPLFLSLYVGLQFGLPDSFRTGANSTGHLVFALILNQINKARVLAAEKMAYVRLGLRSQARKLEGKVIKRIFRRAERVATLHAALTSRADDYFRRTLLGSLGEGLSGRELRNLTTSDHPANLDRHVGKLLDLGLVEESRHYGVERYRRTALADQSLDALCTLERKLGEEEARHIYDADLGPNSIHLFLRIYGDKKPYPEKGLEVSYSLLEMGKMSLFLPRTMEGYSAIDKLNLAGLLVCDDDVFHVPPVKARTFYQYLKRLYAISRVAR